MLSSSASVAIISGSARERDEQYKKTQAFFNLLNYELLYRDLEHILALNPDLIILDEAQNTTRNSMVSALTRIGEGSKMIVTGDTQQSDRGDKNGLTDFLARYHVCDRIAVVEFEKADVERHPVINTVLKWYGED